VIAGDNDTDDKFFAGINDTGEQLSPVTDTGNNIFSPVSLIPVINNQKAQNLSPVSTTPLKKLSTAVNDTADKFIGSANDIADKTVLPILSSQKMEKKIIYANFSHLSLVSSTPLTNIHSRLICEFSKKIETIPMAYSGARGTLIYEKNLKSKISCQTPFMYFNPKKMFFKV
jgi:hypothetical protein